jgi:NTP pyrophosphatase (non-canonical NTP hydrolase)
MTKDLTFKEFSVVNKIRCELPSGFNHSVASWSTSDWFLAMTGELGEAANIAKKLNRCRDGIKGNRESELELREQLRREIADIFIYLDLLCTHEGIDLEDAIKTSWNTKSSDLGYKVTL